VNAAFAALAPKRLRARDLARVSSVGIRTRKLRAGLSAIGIAIGVAAIVAVLGLSSSSQAGLLAEIDRLGTNLLTVTAGQSPSGDTIALPASAPAMMGRISDVTDVEATAELDELVYRNPYIDEVNTNGLAVLAAGPGLLPGVGTELAEGRFLNDATAIQPTVVLGAAAAGRLGIDHVVPGTRILIGSRWFYVLGILEPATLAPEIDSAVLIGFAAAEQIFGFDGHPTTIYVRTDTDEVEPVRPLLAPTANPTEPSAVTVSRPSDALVARAKAQSALNSLFLGLGAISLLVGTVGVANIMVISVLERRSEIGLRRALGATKGHIRIQFLGEAILLSLLGGVVGIVVGVAATAIYATSKQWAIVIPTVAWAGGFGAAILIGAVAGLMPALRAAKMSPTEALWSV
jgi:putative ABC transport system permease protein